MVSWGFLAKFVENDDKTEVYGNFKNLLNPGNLKIWDSRKTDSALSEGFEKVRQLYLDFFRALYTLIDKSFNAWPSPWQGWDVEFIFSVPPAWNASTLYHFRNLVKDAGFASVRGSPSQIVLLTEAEAVVRSVLDDFREQPSVSFVPILMRLSSLTKERRSERLS